MSPPQYRGDKESDVKELGSDQRLILDMQMADHARLNEVMLRSDLRNRLAAGEVTLPAGTLLHGTRYDHDTVVSIASYGVMSGELFGIPEDSETYYCADFFKTEEDMTVAEYCLEIAGDEPDTGRFKRARMEGNYLPSPKTRIERMGIIIDSAIPEIQPLLEADAYKSDAEPLFHGIIDHLPVRKDSPAVNRIAAILGGVPRGAIAGIIVSDKLADNAEHIADITEVFGSSMPILSVDGRLIL